MRDPSLAEKIKDLQTEFGDKIHRLESIKEKLELIPPTKSVSRNDTKTLETPIALGNKAFVVHGHDEGARESVARFLEKLKIQTIILHERASGGRTIIEKLEHNSDVDFAIVLLTPDDSGAVASAGDKFNPRARQNVILELGHFVGKLGRSRVCALHKGSVELPSDFLGVVYVPMDEGGAWRLVLARELRAAAFDVDLNAVL